MRAATFAYTIWRGDMKHPERWRETCDPFSLKFNDFILREILGYPHCGNDVFHVRGEVNGEEVTAYIKVARKKEAAIDNEVHILNQLNAPVFPKVLDYDREHGLFSVTKEVDGIRLSNLVDVHDRDASLIYAEEYGATLARLHTLKINAKLQNKRRFFFRPSKELLKKLDLAYLEKFFDNEPSQGKTVFCHGDFHYANVLWKNRRINAIFDFELSGYGDRDFDVAWAFFLRPGQNFFKTDQELECFLNGYRKFGELDQNAVKYYMAQCYVYFLDACGEEKTYCEYIRTWLKEHCVC